MNDPDRIVIEITTDLGSFELGASLRPGLAGVAEAFQEDFVRAQAAGLVDVAIDPQTFRWVDLVTDPARVLGRDEAKSTLLGPAEGRGLLGALMNPACGRASEMWQKDYSERVTGSRMSLAGILRYAELHRAAWGTRDTADVRDVVDGFLGDVADPSVTPGYDRSSGALLDHYLGNVGERIRPQRPPARQDPADLVSDLLEGMYPHLLGDLDTYVHTQDWTRYTRAGLRQVWLPCVRVHLESLQTAPTVTSIQVAATHGADTTRIEPAAWRTFTPEDADGWRYALHCARVSNLLAGQLYGHLGRGHVVPQTYRRPTEELKADHPVRRLLTPFLQMVEEINDLGKPLIFREGGILCLSSALGVAGVQEALYRAVAEEQFEGWMRPHEQVTSPTSYHTAAAAFSRATQRFVRAHLEPHRDTIALGWGDIERFARSLHAEREAWHRGTTGGYGASPATAEIRDFDDLCRACEHAIFFAAFYHTWTNAEQWHRGGDPAAASFGLRSASPPAEGETYEQWREHVIPVVGDGLLQITLADVLTHTPYIQLGDLRQMQAPPNHPTVLTHEGLALYRELYTQLVKEQPAFDEAGFPIDKLRPFVAI